MTRKIAICSLRIGEAYRNITKYTAINKQEYCDKYNYTYIEDLSIHDTTKTPHWSKLLLVLKYLSQYDYIVWIDADIFIMNSDLSIDSFIDRLMKSADIMIGSDWKMSNTGVMIIKNSEWSRSFLTDVYNYQGPSPNGNYEQGAFQDLHEKNVNNAKDHIIVTEPHELNSYWFNYYKGYFILHAAGCNGEMLTALLNKYCPVKMESDTEESYNARLIWLQDEYRKDADRLMNK